MRKIDRRFDNDRLRLDMMNTAPNPARQAGRLVPLQPASLDTWRQKYCLRARDGQDIDHSIDDTYARIARALAAVEQSSAQQAEWEAKFMWALQNGALPVASSRTLARLCTNQQLPPSIARCRAPWWIPWTISSANCMKRA